MVRLGTLLYRLKAAGHTIILSEQPFSLCKGIPLTGLFLWKMVQYSAIYDHNEALRLKREQLRNMEVASLSGTGFSSGRCVSVKAGGYLAGF